MTSPAPNKLTIAAVLLAGGESSRMGEAKALLSWVNGEPIVAYQVHSLHAAGYAPIVVVLGHEPEAIATAIPSDIGAILVINPRYQLGRSSSIVAGVQAIAAPPPDAVLIISVDQPRSTDMLRALRDGWAREKPAIAVPSLDHRVGHPPLFDGALVPELLHVTEEQQGLRQIMQAHADDRIFVNVVDPLTLTNLNTREDYEAALKLARPADTEQS